MIEKKGPLQKDRAHGGQERQAAWLKAHRSQTALLLWLYAALGFVPASRNGIHIPPPLTEPSEFEKLLDSY